VIVAQDLANQCHKSRAMVHVNVIDQNDNFPTFSKTEYNASIAENAPKGTFVIKVLRIFCLAQKQCFCDNVNSEEMTTSLRLQ